MIRFRHWMFVTLALTATGAMAQAVTFYEQDSFRGRNFVQDGPIADFQRFGFNDRASSVVIRRGTWQICSDARFGGRCVTLRPGSYRSLDAMGLSDRVSSARPVSDSGRPPPPRPGPGNPPPYPGNPSPYPGNPPSGGVSNTVTLFDGQGLSGDRFRVAEDIPNLDRTQWNDRARSMIVRQGRWQLCTDANFRGNCTVFGPGRYDNIGNQTGSVSSIRRVR
ncbi:MAG: beta/gamma crystallin-related protein [Betaproteobacteria bacterium]